MGAITLILRLSAVLMLAAIVCGQSQRDTQYQRDLEHFYYKDAQNTQRYRVEQAHAYSRSKGPPSYHYKGPPAHHKGPPAHHYKGPPAHHYKGPPAHHYKGPPAHHYKGPPAHHYYYKKYYYKPYKWPKIMGRCKVSPAWKWNSTVQPVLDNEGNVVVLFLTKRTSKFCMDQLDTLNDLAAYYKKRKRAVTFVVLNHRRYKPLPRKFKQKFPLLKFYEEPKTANIFKQLGAGFRQFLIYDKCGRQQYHFGYPYSSLHYYFVRHGIVNALDHSDQLCGKCEPKIVGPDLTPDTTPRPSPATTFAPIAPVETTPNNGENNGVFMAANTSKKTVIFTNIDGPHTTN